MGCDFFRKRGIRYPQDGSSWPTARLWFVDLLPDHLHEILATSSLCGFVKFTLIRAFFGTWGCGSATPPTAPSDCPQCRQFPWRVAARDACRIPQHPSPLFGLFRVPRFKGEADCGRVSLHLSLGRLSCARAASASCA